MFVIKHFVGSGQHFSFYFLFILKVRQFYDDQTINYWPDSQ